MMIMILKVWMMIIHVDNYDNDVNDNDVNNNDDDNDCNDDDYDDDNDRPSKSTSSSS